MNQWCRRIFPRDRANPVACLHGPSVPCANHRQSLFRSVSAPRSREAFQ